MHSSIVAPKKILSVIRDLPSKLKFFKKGDLIEAEHKTAKGIYIVERGLIKLTVTDTTKNQIISVLGNGYVFGVNCLFNVENEFSFYSLEDVEVSFLDKSEVLKILPLHLTDFATYYIEHVATHLKNKILRDVRGKVAEKIVSILLSASECNNGWIKITRDDIANYCNCSKEHATRTLSGLKRRGVILTDGHHIKVNDKIARQKYPHFF